MCGRALFRRVVFRFFSIALLGLVLSVSTYKGSLVVHPTSPESRSLPAVKPEGLDQYREHLEKVLKSFGLKLDIVTINKVTIREVFGVKVVQKVALVMNYSVDFGIRATNGALENCEASWDETTFGKKFIFNVDVKCADDE